MFHVKHFFLSGCFFCLKRRLCLKRHGGFASNGRFLSENAGFCLKNDPPRFVLGANQHLLLFFWSSQLPIFQCFLTFSAFSGLLAFSDLLISRSLSFLGAFCASLFAVAYIRPKVRTETPYTAMPRGKWRKRLAEREKSLFGSKPRRRAGGRAAFG